MTGGPWAFEHHIGSAAESHGRTVAEPVRRSVWWLEVAAPAIVLGSTQADDVVDAAAGARHGVEVARRRSGGGAVWLAPGEVTWIDVVVPATDDLWVSDIGRSTDWLGSVWVDVLAGLGVDGAAAHPGPLVRTPWSPLICFAGLGPGEIVVDGRKVIGISQRRSRHAARFQCAVLHRWRTRPLVDLLNRPALARTAMAEILDGPGGPLGLEALGVDVAGETVVDALCASLRRLS